MDGALQSTTRRSGAHTSRSSHSRRMHATLRATTHASVYGRRGLRAREDQGLEGGRARAKE
eukprot:5427611-Pleurochrysis_carterae.AAC.5